MHTSEKRLLILGIRNLFKAGVGHLRNSIRNPILSEQYSVKYRTYYRKKLRSKYAKLDSLEFLLSHRPTIVKAQQLIRIGEIDLGEHKRHIISLLGKPITRVQNQSKHYEHSILMYKWDWFGLKCRTEFHLSQGLLFWVRHQFAELSTQQKEQLLATLKLKYELHPTADISELELVDKNGIRAWFDLEVEKVAHYYDPGCYLHQLIQGNSSRKAALKQISDWKQKKILLEWF